MGSWNLTRPKHPLEHMNMEFLNLGRQNLPDDKSQQTPQRKTYQGRSSPDKGIIQEIITLQCHGQKVYKNLHNDEIPPFLDTIDRILSRLQALLLDHLPWPNRDPMEWDPPLASSDHIFPSHPHNSPHIVEFPIATNTLHKLVGRLSFLLPPILLKRLRMLRDMKGIAPIGGLRRMVCDALEPFQIKPLFQVSSPSFI